ncbi:MAG TPA: LysR family transcriptional regulator [Pararobbsia sp.]|nr:LysR family transcriptional regulator [Pararobbsia sp.]
MLNPVWIQTFATVASSRSFTDAARRLGITQSSVSDHIRRLEDSVGRRLFIRDTHSLALTADGESLLVHARLIIEAHARAESQFKGPRLRGRVRFGTSDDLVLGFLPRALAAFRDMHPDVELEITIGKTDDLYKQLDTDSLDLLIGKRRISGQASVTLFKEPLKWLAKTGTIVDLKQPLPLLLMPEPSITRSLTLNAVAAGGLPWRVICTSSSHTGCIAAARGGLGITAQPAFLTAPGIDSPVNISSLPALPEIEFVFLRAKRLSKPAQTLLEILQQADLRSPG